MVSYIADNQGVHLYFGDSEMLSNLNKAIAVTERIDQLKRVQSAIKFAFKHRELEGGINAAPNHPLHIQAEEEILELQEELTFLI